MSSRAIPISPSAESASQGKKRSLSEEPSDQADSSEDYFNSHTSWAASLFADPPRIHSPIANDYIFTAADRLNEFSFPSPFLDSSIGFPPHYGTQGTTFARRLQQDALERGFELITNKKTPPSILNYAFEYCLPTSNREEITNRLRSLLQQSELGSLLNPNSSTYEKCTPEDSQQRLLSQIFGFETRSSPSANSFETRKPEIGPFQLNTELLSAQDVQSYLQSRGLEINSSSKLLQLPIAQDNPAWQSKGYRIAILSVNKLLDSQSCDEFSLKCGNITNTYVMRSDILDRAVCLSTGPGFRKVDVESALRTSIRLSD
jgi:hypothetical protein